MNETVFYLTKGAIKLETGYKVWVSHNEKFEEVYIENRNEFIDMWTEFTNCILNNTPSPVSGEYGTKIIKTIESIYKSNS